MAKVKRKKPLTTGTGRKLTPEAIYALAAEAERGHDLSEFVLVGRPSLDGSEGIPLGSPCGSRPSTTRPRVGERSWKAGLSAISSGRP
jgi:hypothetical protein